MLWTPAPRRRMAGSRTHSELIRVRSSEAEGFVYVYVVDEERGPYSR